MQGRIRGVVDTDIHNVVSRDQMLARLPEPWRTRLASGSGGHGGLGYWNPNGVFRADAVTDDGRRIEGDPNLLVSDFFDPFNIDYGVLNPSAMHHGLSPEPDFAAALCRAQNDAIAEEWLPVSPRLLGSIIVSQSDPVQAAAEIRRHGANPQFVQVMMGSGARFPFGQRYYDPIYEAASEFGLPIATHPGNEGSGVAGPPTAAGYPTSYLEWHTNLVGTFIAHLISLLVEGTFIKFPTLKFVLTEGGVAWMPPVLWRLDKNWMALRQSVPWLEKKPSEYAKEHVLFTTQPIEEPENPDHLKYVFEMFDVEHMLMFSSDFPHWDGDTPDFTARSIPAQARERVMGLTARDLYGLPAPADIATAPAAD